jgi:hypothetical protein
MISTYTRDFSREKWPQIVRFHALFSKSSDFNEKFQWVAKNVEVSFLKRKHSYLVYSQMWLKFLFFQMITNLTQKKRNKTELHGSVQYGKFLKPTNQLQLKYVP